MAHGAERLLRESFAAQGRRHGLAARALRARTDASGNRAMALAAGRFACVVVLGDRCRPATAGDWPQILGPHRNAKADGEQLVAWGDAGPRTALAARGRPRVRRRGGRQGPARPVPPRSAMSWWPKGSTPATGKSLWKTTFPTRYTSSISSDDGPRCVPLIHDTVGLPAGARRANWPRSTSKPARSAGTGRSTRSSRRPMATSAPAAARSSRGTSCWSMSAAATAPGWSPFRWPMARPSGKPPTRRPATPRRWPPRSTACATSIFVTRLNVVSVDPQNGEVRFRFPFGGPRTDGQRGQSAGAGRSRLRVGQLRSGSRSGLRSAPRGATTVWDSDDVMSSQYTTCVEKDGYLYGIDGRQDVGVARLRCFDPPHRQGGLDPRGLWHRQPDPGRRQVARPQDRWRTGARRPLAGALKPLATAQILSTTTQALPALSDGRLFARDTKTLKCLAVGQPVVAATQR